MRYYISLIVASAWICNPEKI